MNAAAKRGAGRPRKMQSGSQVLGVRVPQELAREVKTELGRSGKKLNQLFAEMWETYKGGHPPEET